MKALLIAVAAAATLSGCGELSQDLGVKKVKSDRQAYQGGDARFTTGQWTAGERETWEQQIRTRNQGQNEYSRSAAAPK